MGRASRRRAEVRVRTAALAGGGDHRATASVPLTGALGNQIIPRTISVTMIVRDEEAVLVGRLRSLRGFADELVVLTTAAPVCWVCGAPLRTATWERAG